MEAWNPWYTGAVWLVAAAVATMGILGERRMVRKARARSLAGLELTPGQETIVNGDDGSGIGTGHPAGELTKRDIVLGARASRFTTKLCRIAFWISVSVGVWTYLNVPLNTRVIARIYRHSEPGPIYALVLFVPVLIWLLMLGSGGKKPDAGHMGKTSRTGLFILSAVMVVWPVYIQFTIAAKTLTEGFTP